MRMLKIPIPTCCVLPILLPFEHCVLRELMRTSLLIRDGLRKENVANLHRQTATH